MLSALLCFRMCTSICVCICALVCVYPVAIWFAFALFCLILCLPSYPAAVCRCPLVSLPRHQRVFINVIIPHFYVHVISYTQYRSLICMHNLRTCCDSPGLDAVIERETSFPIVKGLSMHTHTHYMASCVCLYSTLNVYFLALLWLTVDIVYAIMQTLLRLFSHGRVDFWPIFELKPSWCS